MSRSTNTNNTVRSKGNYERQECIKGPLLMHILYSRLGAKVNNNKTSRQYCLYEQYRVNKQDSLGQGEDVEERVGVRGLHLDFSIFVRRFPTFAILLNVLLGTSHSQTKFPLCTQAVHNCKQLAYRKLDLGCHQPFFYRVL